MAVGPAARVPWSGLSEEVVMWGGNGIRAGMGQEKCCLLA